MVVICGDAMGLFDTTDDISALVMAIWGGYLRDRISVYILYIWESEFNGIFLQKPLSFVLDPQDVREDRNVDLVTSKIWLVEVDFVRTKRSFFEGLTNCLHLIISSLNETLQSIMKTKISRYNNSLTRVQDERLFVRTIIRFVSFLYLRLSLSPQLIKNLCARVLSQYIYKEPRWSQSTAHRP